jgi:hypothetical protein
MMTDEPSFEPNVINACLENIQMISIKPSDNPSFNRTFKDIIQNLSPQVWFKDLVHQICVSDCQKEIAQTADIHSGLHGNASHVKLDEIELFSMEHLGELLQGQAPRPWEFMIALMDSTNSKRRAAEIRAKTHRKIIGRINDSQPVISLRPDSDDESSDPGGTEDYESE